MSGTHAGIADLDAKRRERGGFLGGHGRHRRTHETWVRMEEQVEELTTERDEAREQRDSAHARARRLVQAGIDQSKELKAARAEVERLKRLLGSDADNLANQTTHSFTMPERPQDRNNPVEVPTQPISVGELFKDVREAPKSTRPSRPVIKVYPMPERDVPPVPPYPPSNMPAPHPDAAKRLLSRLNQPSEKVNPDVQRTQLMSLWDAPMAQVPKPERRTA